MTDEITRALLAKAKHNERNRRSKKKSVRGEVAKHLDVMQSAKKSMTWEEVADVLFGLGLTWSNGNKVTGQHLRTIACELRRIPRLSSVVREPAPHSGRTFRLGEEILPQFNTSEKKEGRIDKAKILQEIQRSALERKK